MKGYETFDVMVNNLLQSQRSDHNTREGHNKTETLEGLLDDKLHGLTDILKQIRQEIQTRTRLSQRSINLIYEHYCSVKSKLLQLPLTEPGSNDKKDGRRVSLEQRLDELKHEVREEQHQHWQDTARLNRECRNWLKQYWDLLQRVKLVTGYERDQSELRLQ